MKIVRYPENPLIAPKDVPPSEPGLEVICAFNAGAIRFHDETILLLRVAERATCDADTVRVPIFNGSKLEIREFDRHDPKIDFRDPRVIFTPHQIFLTSISHLRIARSRDGRKFAIDPRPALFPDRASEAFGLEDPRITRIGDDFFIPYKSVSPNGICTSLAVTRDFIHFEKKGIIFCPENLDVCIFPEKIGGRYAALHRPVPHFLGGLNVWIAYSPDLISWGDHRLLMGVRPGGWESGRIGGGAVPIKTDRGWLAIYHGATMDDKYCLGAALLKTDEPHKVLARSREPILTPEAPYEREGFVPNVVFSCGAVTDGDRLSIYYGAGDAVTAGADVSISEVLDSLEIVSD
jgi:predicted GH43/DUF377 family glycosyl hydrolase